MSSQIQLSSEELAGVYEKFREIKHSINNSLAVIMALSELSERNPVHYEKLAQAVLTRCPQIVTQLQEFQEELPKFTTEETGDAAET